MGGTSVEAAESFPLCRPLIGELNCGFTACYIDWGFALPKNLVPAFYPLPPAEALLVEGETGFPRSPDLRGKQKLMASPSFLRSSHFGRMSATEGPNSSFGVVGASRKSAFSFSERLDTRLSSQATRLSPPPPQCSRLLDGASRGPSVEICSDAHLVP